MNDFRLISTSEACERLANLWLASNSQRPLLISVADDKCFGGRTLDLGKVRLFPGEPNSSDEALDSIVSRATQYGFYQWELPPYEAVLHQLLELVFEGKSPRSDRQRMSAERALGAIAAGLLRLGLLQPWLDADCIAGMPFRRPTTVVVDTSAVVNGGMDFVARFLCPTARIKIPALVQMEIHNLSDNFLALRRNQGKQYAGEMLEAHVRSQGAQRALLRMSNLTGVEVERTPLLSDPLRNAFQQDRESDAKSLNVTSAVRSYADRLIVETARQHEFQIMSGHPLMVMTCDQGMARLSMAEGFPVLFFEVPTVADAFGQVLTGTVFHPFSGAIYGVSLAEVVWELAAMFGAAVVSSADGSAALEVAAIGEGIGWLPYHSKEDLLWARGRGSEVSGNGSTEPNLAGAVEGKPRPATREAESQNVAASPFSMGVGATPTLRDMLLDAMPETPNEPGIPIAASTSQSSTVARKPERASQTQKGFGAYGFRVDAMLKLIGALASKGSISQAEAMELTSRSVNYFAEYRGFLTAGGFAVFSGRAMTKTPALDDLWAAITLQDLPRLSSSLRRVPSFNRLFEALETSKQIQPSAPPVPERALSTYVTLLEVSASGLMVPEKGILFAALVPQVREFADMALKAYSDILRDGDYVLAGAWLEYMADKFFVHPTTSRVSLEQARTQELIECYTEGATPDTRYERHSFKMIEMRQGEPDLRLVHLYHGDFLISGKASVIIRLERGPSWT